MPRKPELEPRWLVGLLHQWAMRELYGSTKGLGYYSVNPMLKDGIPTPARSYEPTGYSGGDFRELEQAMKEMQVTHEMELRAVIRYAMPWRAKGIDEEFPRETRLWLRDLRSGLATIDAKMRDGHLTTRNLVATMLEM